MAKTTLDTFFAAGLLISFSMQQPETIAFSYLLCAAYVTLRINSFRIKVDYVYLYAALTIPCLLAVFTYKHGVTSPIYLLLTPLVIIAAKIFSSQSITHVVASLRNLYWISALGIGVSYGLHFTDSEPLGAIIPGSSTNGLPSYLIVVQIAYSISHFLKSRRLPVLSSISTFGVAVLGLGRGSIIVSLLIVLLGTIINLFQCRSNLRIRLLFIAAFLVTPLAALFLSTEIDTLALAAETAINRSKFSAGIFDEHRSRILADYLSKIDAWSIFFGASYDRTSISQYYGGNPHNSFMRAHAFYGLCGIASIFLPLIFILISKRDLVQKGVTLALILLSLMRATTEPILFPSPLDLFYFIYFFIFMKFAEEKRRPPQGHHMQNP